MKEYDTCSLIHLKLELIFEVECLLMWIYLNTDDQWETLRYIKIICWADNELIY